MLLSSDDIATNTLFIRRMRSIFRDHVAFDEIKKSEIFQNCLIAAHTGNLFMLVIQNAPKQG